MGPSTVTVRYFIPTAKTQTTQLTIHYLCSLPSSVSSLHCQVVMSLLLSVQRLGCVKDASRGVYRKPVIIYAECNLAVWAMVGIFNCQLQHGTDRDAQIRDMRVTCYKTCKKCSVENSLKKKPLKFSSPNQAFSSIAFTSDGDSAPRFKFCHSVTVCKIAVL